MFIIQYKLLNLMSPRILVDLEVSSEAVVKEDFHQVTILQLHSLGFDPEFRLQMFELVCACDALCMLALYLGCIPTLRRVYLG